MQRLTVVARQTSDSESMADVEPCESGELVHYTEAQAALDAKQQFEAQGEVVRLKEMVAQLTYERDKQAELVGLLQRDDLAQALVLCVQSRDFILQEFCTLQITYGEQKHELRHVKALLDERKGGRTMKSIAWFFFGAGLALTGQAIATDYFVYPNGDGNSVIFGSDGSQTRTYGDRYFQTTPEGGTRDGYLAVPYPKSPC